MNAITTFDLTSKQIALVKQTIAKDCNDEEFNLYMEVAKAKRLDPFLKQIIPMVFSKNNAEKRNMTIIISRDGQRVIAQRCGDYRPASKPPTYEFDPSLKGPLNPHGIVSATVYLWKQDPKSSEWYEVAGQSFWDEFAPIKDEWAKNDNGKSFKTGKQTLDDSGNWARMPRLMIAKCAEMQALRAGCRRRPGRPQEGVARRSPMGIRVDELGQEGLGEALAQISREVRPAASQAEGRRRSPVSA